MAAVIFEVDCPSTKPGECVYVIGGPDALGGWKVEKALALTTNADRFPIWSSGQVTFASDSTIEYKFLVRKEGLPASAAVWESFASNRQLDVVTGQQVTATSAWDKADGTVLDKKDVEPKPAPPPAAEVEPVAVEEVENAKELAERLEEREPMRKNFSQSLMCLDVDAEEEGFEEVTQTVVEEPEELPQPKKSLRAMTTDFSPAKQAQPKARRAATTELRQTPPRHSADLKGISSFSCLTVLAEVEEKEIARSAREESKYKPYNLDVPVVIVTSEVAPYSKTGGLGLVAASYCYEFPRKGHRTMVVSPKYKHFDGIAWVGETKVIVNGREEVVKFWHKFVSCGGDDTSGCDHIFVDHNAIERAGGLYNGDDGREYADNLFRFTLLSMAAMEAPLILNLSGRGTYGDKVLFLANDWQAGLVPFYLNHKYRRNGCYVQSRAIYVIHNLGYQGQYPHVPVCHFFGVDQAMAKDLEFGDCVNLSKAALLNADRIIAVSPTYAQEIRTQGGGFRLESFVSRQGDLLRLCGILNGIDDVWNPETDKDVYFNYSVKNFIEGKRANKAKLQESLGLNQDPDAVLIGFCGRLTWQKGVDIMVQIVDWLMADTGNGVTGRAQLIMMGQGERQYADALRWGESTYPGRVCGYVGFDPKVEHLMMAGCDLLLMPSRYEPCGLPQMCAQRYGTLPIVTATGGLVDSVKDVSIGVDKATGFHMSPLAKDQMSEVVYKACQLYLKQPADFRTMQKTAMLEDFYWPQAMDEYEKAIDQTLYDPPLPR